MGIDDVYPEKQMIQVFGSKGVKLPKNQITKIPLTAKDHLEVTDMSKVAKVVDGGLQLLYTGFYIVWGSVYFESDKASDVGIYLKKSKNYKDYDSAVEILSRRNGSGLQGAMNIGPFLIGVQDGDTIYLCGRSIGADSMFGLGKPNVTYLGAWRVTL